MLSLPYESGLFRYFQARNVPLGMKPPQDFQAPSLIPFAAVCLLGVGWHDLEGRRLVPAAFDFGVHEHQENLVVVTRNRRANDVELEWLRVLNRANGTRSAKPVLQRHRRPFGKRPAAIFTGVFNAHGSPLSPFIPPLAQQVPT